MLPQGEISYHADRKLWINVGQPLIEETSLSNLVGVVQAERREIIYMMNRFFSALNNALSQDDIPEIKARAFGFSPENVKVKTQQSDSSSLSVKLIITDLASRLTYSYGHLGVEKALPAPAISGERREAIRLIICNYLRATESDS